MFAGQQQQLIQKKTTKAPRVWHFFSLSFQEMNQKLPFWNDMSKIWSLIGKKNVADKPLTSLSALTDEPSSVKERCWWHCSPNKAATRNSIFSSFCTFLNNLKVYLCLCVNLTAWVQIKLFLLPFQTEKQLLMKWVTGVSPLLPNPW